MNADTLHHLANMYVSKMNIRDIRDSKAQYVGIAMLAMAEKHTKTNRMGL